MTRAEMEARRLRAVPDILAGMRPVDLARKYRVSRTAIYRWRDRARAGLVASRKSTGRPPRVSYDLLVPLLRKRGYREVAAEIERRFGVRYDRNHVGQLAARFLREKHA